MRFNKMNVNNRRVDKEDLTFFQWLNIYELMTKKEFKELEEPKQENYKREFEMWRVGISQHNKYKQVERNEMI